MSENDLTTYRKAYFLGIGGIGMSAIARYFHAQGMQICGYDKTPSPLTDELTKEGINIVFEDAISTLPEDLVQQPENWLIVYTPAIPPEHVQLNYLRSKELKLYKRSEVLGNISRNSYCIAVAGTHGKTTTSSLISHILYSCNVNFTAFLGGISSNYNNNYIHKTDGASLFENKKIVVLEADEFDRSFHRLNPDIAVVTAADPDHLDIYGTAENFKQAFEIFLSKIQNNGHAVIQSELNLEIPFHITAHRYGLDKPGCDFTSNFSGVSDGYFKFNFTSEIRTDDVIAERQLQNISAGLPGFHNIENATAALGVCLDLLNLEAYDVKDAVKSFKGVKRRFEFVHRSEARAVIDDYAHHPQELRAIIRSARELFPDRRLNIIFQPHLYSRTRDFADEFAEALSMADSVILMDIYPAREQPIPGVSSSWLLDKIMCTDKRLLTAEEIFEGIRKEMPDLLLITGAGDIDRIVPEIKRIYDEN